MPEALKVVKYIHYKTRIIIIVKIQNVFVNTVARIQIII